MCVALLCAPWHGLPNCSDPPCGAVSPLSALQDAVESTLVVLNEMQQFAACVPSLPPPAAGGSSPQRSTALARAAPLECDVLQVRPWHTADSAVAAGFQSTASHLLATATELCPLSLERLLLA